LPDQLWGLSLAELEALRRHKDEEWRQSVYATKWAICCALSKDNQDEFEKVFAKTKKASLDTCIQDGAEKGLICGRLIEKD